MNGWKMVPLGSVVEPPKTWNPSRSSACETFDYIDISAVDQDTKRVLGASTVLCAEAPSRARQLVAKGDVLVSTVRPNLNGVARVPEELDGATASTGFCVLRARPALLDGGYLFHWVKTPSFVGDMGRKATGASYPAVSDRIITESLFPLPPLEEQRRIAGVLDRAEALRAKRRVALAQLDTLTQAIFIHMFGDPASNPKRWLEKPLGSEIESVRYGTGSPPEYVKNGVPFIRATNIKNGSINPKDLVRISLQDADQIPKCKTSFGNLIVVRSGVNTGDCAIITREYDGAYAAYDLIVELSMENAVFYNFLINSSYGKQCLSPLTRRAALPHLNADQLRTLKFIAPPMKVKVEFALRVASVEKLKNSHRASLAEMDTLFAALQYRAFQGEL